MSEPMCWKQLEKQQVVVWSEDMISALHQQHSNMSQASSGFMLIVFTLQTYILFWQSRIFKNGWEQPEPFRGRRHTAGVMLLTLLQHNSV